MARPKRERKLMRDYYGGAGLAYRIFQESSNNPEGPKKKLVNGKETTENVEIGDQKFSLDTQGFIGWGPIHFEKFLFNSHYVYSQSWGTDMDQIGRFTNSWMKERKAETFIFPTKALIRTHEIAADFRYLDLIPDLELVYSLGIFGRLEMKRQGSSTLGDDNESATTINLLENAVPYLSFQVGRSFRTQFWMPFFTDVNKVDETKTYATYSWSKAGRGKVFSFVSNNELLLTGINSRLLIDGYYYKFKYSSLTLDYDRPGGAISFDFPVFYGLRLQPRVAYNADKYYLKKVRIPGMLKKDGNGAETVNDKAQEYLRTDVNYSFGGGAYIDLGEKNSHRVFLEFSQTQIVSTLLEYNGSSTSWYFGYKWALPSAGLGERRINRFREGVYADSF